LPVELPQHPLMSHAQDHGVSACPTLTVSTVYRSITHNRLSFAPDSVQAHGRPVRLHRNLQLLDISGGKNWPLHHNNISPIRQESDTV
jgi:hypothetical protein